MASQTAQLIDIPDDILLGTNVFLRVDFNVPLSFEKIDEEDLSTNYAVLSNSRINDSLPTINYLREKGAKIVIYSHLGRPKSLSTIEERKKKFSLKHISNILSTMINTEVKFVDDCIGEKLQHEINNNMENG
jgi:phosphoglycerate kinase